MDERRTGEKGQVVVEMLLVLPVFLAMVFCIMEIGYLSFQMIVLNHATYEVARIGGMTYANPPSYGCAQLTGYMKEILPRAEVQCDDQVTKRDPQSEQDNRDLVITGIHEVPLVFPFSRQMLSPERNGKRTLKATVRMPIETPLKK